MSIFSFIMLLVDREDRERNREREHNVFWANPLEVL